MPDATLAIFAAATGSLFVAYIAENFFDVQPCILCIYQRIPFAVVSALSIIALIFRDNDKMVRTVLSLCALAFFINAGIAIFHSGVELHWWAGTDECGVNPLVLKQIANLREVLLKTPLVSCDAINFTLFGLTMANWNILASFGLGLFSLLAAFRSCLNWAKQPSCSVCCPCGTDTPD
ncbi:MAG: disulfide bond formation protein B [Alphaproteobacteria bacterium]|nr:disulfide bond formation protein B [Alphaproteobacteria bacterium]